uniref:orotate phosphoribosyltransferase n=1 Tax=Flammulina velutipes TaxID=38945 RepID=A0A286M3C7_FLAVE|nr:orotate phosphoribosyltransferase [Flammulina velutipes]
MSSSLSPSQKSLIVHSTTIGALKFGSFTLKSGRQSPYFFNSSLLSTGPALAALATALADTIIQAGWEFDVLFGPAYKGISLAAITVVELNRRGVDVGMAYDRKEAKDHGEGGLLVGVPMNGKRVVIVDDVMTSGKAIRGALDCVAGAGGSVAGVVQILDRQEVGQQGNGSTVTELETLLGAGTVKAILQMQDLLGWLEHEGQPEQLAAMKAYWEQYGVKNE